MDNEQVKKTDASDAIDFKNLDGDELAELLQEQPQLADKCDLSKLDGWEWASLLQKQPQFADKCDWGKLSLRAVSALLEEQPGLLECAKSGCGIRGKVFEIEFVAEMCPIELGRRWLEQGERVHGDWGYVHGGGVAEVLDGSTTYYADGEPQASRIIVRIDGKTLLNQALDFANPGGLSFENRGPLFDRKRPSQSGRWLYGAEWWKGVYWKPWTMLVVDDFVFEPGKLLVPFYRARTSEDGTEQFVIQPLEIRYGDLAPDGDALWWDLCGCSKGWESWTE